MTDTNQSQVVQVTRLTIADQIDLICDAFEDAWVSGETPDIEKYLECCDPSYRDPLLGELLLVDREYRIRRGEAATRQSYRDRYPNYSTVIDSVEFATIDERGRRRLPLPSGQTMPKAGDVIAHFALLEELGMGASGVVWKARDTQLKRLVAIKIPRQDFLSPFERERFVREGQACAQLRHANIVAIYAVGEDRGRVFIVSEFIEGCDLRDWLRERRFTWTEAADFTAQLAVALHHAHEQGIIHRDLKPANVLIDTAGTPHITDFGLAKWVADGTHFTIAGNVVGTPAYMPPEQASGGAFNVDRRSDVYGLGALLYEMLTGKPPFAGDVATIIHKVIHEEPPTPRKVDRLIPRDLETICLASMKKDAHCRYSTAHEMAIDLRSFIQSMPISARRSSLLEKSWRWVQRRPAVATAITLAAISIGLFGIASKGHLENRALLGIQPVIITTNPPGAKLAFVPINNATGMRNMSDVVYARSSTPTLLLPRCYEVIAVLPDGRFHEVLREIPRSPVQLPSAENHRWCRQLPSGELELAKIEIPENDIVMGMACIEGSATFIAGTSGSPTLPAHARRIASFYIDAAEFTEADFQRTWKQLPGNRAGAKPADWALPATYDQAVFWAERLGKRLPTEFEYEYVATNQGNTTYSWGNESGQVEGAVQLGPVKSPSFDQISSSPAVFGLCSNVAEWTSSLGIPYPPHPNVLSELTVNASRVVRGGSSATVDGDANVSPESRNPRARLVVPRETLEPGLGFRCVRSVAPPIPYEDFP